MKAGVTDEVFMEAWRANDGSPAKVSRALGIAVRNVYSRRRSIEGRLKQEIESAPHPSYRAPAWAYHRLREFDFPNGVVIVYSDAHYWPGEPTIAFCALLELCAALKPTVVVANGDLIDGAKISRFPSAGWARLPSMTEELALMQERQSAIVQSAPKAKLFRTIGNHDLRLDRFFVQNAEQFEGLPGTRLSDFLPDWPESYTVKLNDTHIKHRFRGGTHAAWNNALQAGVSIVTGHLHNLEAKSLRGYRDARIWGVQTGTIAENPFDAPKEGGGPFEYVEDSPTHWASGFAVLTYSGGRLLPPEFCSVEFGKAWFRGKVVL